MSPINFDVDFIRHFREVTPEEELAAAEIRRLKIRNDVKDRRIDELLGKVDRLEAELRAVREADAARARRQKAE